jgi:regulator of replication initiation timing
MDANVAVACVEEWKDVDLDGPHDIHEEPWRVCTPPNCSSTLAMFSSDDDDDDDDWDMEDEWNLVGTNVQSHPQFIGVSQSTAPASIRSCSTGLGCTGCRVEQKLLEQIDVLKQTVAKQETSIIRYRSECSQLAGENCVLRAENDKYKSSLREKEQKIELCGVLMNRARRSETIGANIDDLDRSGIAVLRAAKRRGGGTSKQHQHHQQSVITNRCQQLHPSPLMLPLPPPPLPPLPMPLSLSATEKFVRSVDDSVMNCPFSHLLPSQHNQSQLPRTNTGSQMRSTEANASAVYRVGLSLSPPFSPHAKPKRDNPYPHNTDAFSGLCEFELQ